MLIRHKYIMEVLEREGIVRVVDIAKELDVTTVTIRKDLKILEEKGLLYRTHGSASLLRPYITDENVTEKEKVNTSKKNRIGIEAAKMVEENDSIILNSGSTVLMFAEQIMPKGLLNVVTSSIKATLVLGDKPNVNIVQLGGHYRKRSISVTGNYTTSFLKDITCTKLFLGVGGIDVDYGVTTSNIEEVELNKAMMDAALRTIVLCDSSKFGQKGFGKICNIDKIDTIITDSGISNSMVKMIEDMGVNLIVV